MKKGFWIAVALVVIFLLGIGLRIAFGPGKAEVVTDVGQYLNKATFNGKSGLQVFPDRVNQSQTEKYYYFYQDQFLDEAVQIYLRCVYSDEEFQKECERLEGVKLSHDGEVHTLSYNTKDYPMPAYEAIRAADHCYEYALVDRESRVIEYVFLQFIPEKEVIFDRAKLPAGYEKEEEDSYNMYAFPAKQFQEGKGYEPVYQ